jgi:peptidoglycan/xylan/chitin deacetylase (PgdA/CDA1 family)
LFRRTFAVVPDRPIISFSFDDFPASALHNGGTILKNFGVTGTYYLSLGLMDSMHSSGRMFSAADLTLARDEGHELGCHTFSHCHSGDTNPRCFEEAILSNQKALDKVLPGARFKTFAYPISCPRPFTKLRASKHFQCCRGSGQISNVMKADLNNLSAYFLEKSRHDIQLVKDQVDNNNRDRGWLIFATHDVSDSPSPYGCTPRFFEEVVCYAVQSGAHVVPVSEALDFLTPGSGARYKSVIQAELSDSEKGPDHFLNRTSFVQNAFSSLDR